MIDGSKLPITDSIYTFVAPDGSNTNIHSALLREWCLRTQPEVVLVPVEKHLAASFITDNIVSTDRLKELSKRYLRSNAHIEPIIMCEDGGATDGQPNVLLVDGHHRYCIAALVHSPYISASILTVAQWKPFQITNLPLLTQAQLKMFPITHRSY